MLIQCLIYPALPGMSLGAPVVLVLIVMTEAIAVTLCCELTAACPADTAPWHISYCCFMGLSSWLSWSKAGIRHTVLRGDGASGVCWMRQDTLLC